MRLVTLGGVALYEAGSGEPTLGPGKPLALLTYLALTPGRRTSREFLMDLLWADLEPERARSALRQALFHLRRLLGEDALTGTEELTLVRPIEADRDRFLRAIESGDLEAAIAEYAGEFLPDFGIPGGASFEHWADLERSRLRAAFLRSAELVVRRHLNHSRFREAQRLARRVRDDVPNAEVAWRLVLETVVAGRDFVSAAVEAEAVERWATTEGLVLDPATRLAIAQARHVSPPLADLGEDTALMAELTGREREFSAITGAWDAVRTGAARHLHLTAPAGLGKTRLLRDAVARLQAGGAAVVMLRGVPGDRDVPYAFAGDLAMAVAQLPGAAGIGSASAASLIGLNPALSSRLAGLPDAAQGEDALRRRILALTDLVQAAADERPFVLVVDDLHWLDRWSYQVFDGVLGRLGGAHVLCLTAARPDLRPGGEATLHLPLAPLTEPQVASLVAALGALPGPAGWAGDFVRRVHQATNGSPLLILQTIRLALDDGVLGLDGGEWRCHDQARLTSLLRSGEALRQRIRALPDDQRWLLALLATAGGPLAQDALAQALQRAPAEVAGLLAELERHGLIMRVDGEWAPAHDEIGAAARDAIAGARRSEADRTIGLLLAGAAGDDPHRLLRGARHLVAAGEMDQVRLHFRRYARLLRRRGDRRPFPDLAREFAGAEPGSAAEAGLTGALPLAWRIGLWSPARQGAVAAALLIGVISVLATASLRRAQEQSTQRLYYVDSTGTTRVIAIDPGEFDGRQTALAMTGGSSSFTDAALAFPEYPPAISPDGRSVAWIQDAGDSTTLDIWLRTPAGTRRLTTNPRDDLVTSWLPDGSGLVGLTSRWSPPGEGHYDVAVYDTATGTARQVTSGPGHDQSPYSSPDGTRIAFVQQREDGPPLLCVTTADGRDPPACRLPAGEQPMSLLGWASDVELIVTTQHAGARPLVRYDWERDEVSPLFGADVLRGQLSPDRRWLVASARAEGVTGLRDWLIPVDRPTQARQVRADGGVTASPRWWQGLPGGAGPIVQLQFADTASTIPLGVGTRLGVRALAADGTELPLRAPLRWTSSDTLVATVDERGEVWPRARGTVTIEASLAGWRSVRRGLTVMGEPVETVYQESWDSDWNLRWITFGDPAPIVVEGPGGVRSFWNRGDGTYPSLAVLRRAFRARQGLGLELRLSTPVGPSSGQRARVALVPGVDTTDLRRADPRAAAPATVQPETGCGFSYPGGDGSYGRGQLAVAAGTGTLVELGPLEAQLASGKWWTARLQILPDGRCGVAVNGQVLWLSAEPISLESDFWLRLGDESAGTRLLHGPLDVWTGVRTDIDWSARRQ